MKITNVNFEADTAFGLKSIKMDRLDQIVVLAGPNGAGKSRLLNKISSETTKKIKTPQFLQKQTLIEQLEKKLSGDLYNMLDSHGEPLTPNHEVENLKEQVSVKKKELFESNLITIPLHADRYHCIDFTPSESNNLLDSYTLSQKDIETQRNSIINLGIKNAAKAAIPLIQVVQTEWFNATHQNSQLPDEERSEIIHKYEKLEEYIKMFLGTDIGRDKQGNATLFGFRAGLSRLSEGQKLLLQFCVTLYAQESKLNEIIIWMDEPEKHLHPAALIQVIDKLSSVLTDGQIWIATHNINLLSHVPTSSIWYMDDGSVSYSGNKPERVLRGLLGDEEAVAKLSNFMTLPEQMAGTQFAFECLFPPKSIETDSDDPQTNQIISSINGLIEKKEKIKVLDFGAGKGRLLSTINELEKDADTMVSDWLDYVAYDLPDEDEDICPSHINITYGNSDGRYYTDETILKEEQEKNSVDVIVLCNVFHEIDPKDWLSLFDDQGAIRYLLKESGTLLIVEDQHIPYGEKAYNNGFLVLDKLQFQELFEVDKYEHKEARGDRLRAHFIPANKLGSISKLTRINAINSMLYTSKNKVKEIRDDDNPNFKLGLLHAFWSQQLTNATLALEELDG